MDGRPGLQPSRFSRWLRGLWPDRNPLRRASDRAEAAIMAWLAAALLAGVPLAALTAGRWSLDTGVRIQRAETAWYQVPAVLLVNAPDAPPAWPGSAQPTVLASWTGPDGAQRAGRVPAPVGARAGTKLRVWVDASGRPTGVPLQHRQVEAQAALAAMLASVGLGLVLLGAAALARRVLNRHRLAAWDAAWQAIGPRWTTQY